MPISRHYVAHLQVLLYISGTFHRSHSRQSGGFASTSSHATVSEVGLFVSISKVRVARVGMPTRMSMMARDIVMTSMKMATRTKIPLGVTVQAHP